jgi:hypothetical protein
MAYTFRVRFKLSRVRIQSEAAELRINNEADGRGSVTLRPRDSGVELGDADELVLTGQPYASDQAAVAAARRWVTRLRRAFARLNIGPTSAVVLTQAPSLTRGCDGLRK